MHSVDRISFNIDRVKNKQLYNMSLMKQCVIIGILNTLNHEQNNNNDSL